MVATTNAHVQHCAQKPVKLFFANKYFIFNKSGYEYATVFMSSICVKNLSYNYNKRKQISTIKSKKKKKQNISIVT